MILKCQQQKKHQKVPTLNNNKKTFTYAYPLFVECMTFMFIFFCYKPAGNPFPHCLSTFEYPPPPSQPKVDNLPFLGDPGEVRF